jgi:microcystin-dependent protein
MTSVTSRHIAGWASGYVYQEEQGGGGPKLNTRKIADIYEELFPAGQATFNTIVLNTPTSDNDSASRGVTKGWVLEKIQTLVDGIVLFKSVDYVTTANLSSYVYEAANGTLTSPDGLFDVSMFDDAPLGMIDGRRVLVHLQTNKNENGIYIVSDSSTGQLTRPEDADGDPGWELAKGSVRPVLYGTVHAREIWAQVSETVTEPYAGLQNIEYNMFAPVPDPTPASAEPPVGSLLAMAGESGVDSILEPKGWHYCDGTSYPWPAFNGGSDASNEYQELFAVLQTRHGSVLNDSFQIPDLQNGEFLRGRGGNSGGSVGVKQGDMYGSHTHGVNDGGHNHGITTANLTGSVFGISESFDRGGGGANGVFAKFPQNTFDCDNTPSSTNRSSCGGFSMNASHSHNMSVATTNISNQYAGGNETRPVNMAVRWYIKVKHVYLTPQTVGNGLMLTDGVITAKTSGSIEIIDGSIQHRASYVLWRLSADVPEDSNRFIGSWGLSGAFNQLVSYDNATTTWTFQAGSGVWHIIAVLARDNARARNVDPTSFQFRNVSGLEVSPVGSMDAATNQVITMFHMVDATVAMKTLQLYQTGGDIGIAAINSSVVMTRV